MVDTTQLAQDTVADTGPTDPPTLPAGSICSLNELPGTLTFLDEGDGYIDDGVNDNAYQVFQGIYHVDPDQPLTYLVVLVPMDPDLKLSKTIYGGNGEGLPVYWSALQGLPVIAVPASDAFGLHLIQRKREYGTGTFRSWVYAYVGTNAQDRPPAIHLDDVDVTCNRACGTVSSIVTPTTQTVGTMKFDVPQDQEELTFGVPRAHVFGIELECPGSQQPSVTVGIGESTMSDLVGAAFTGDGGVALVKARDAGDVPLPYSCTVKVTDYGERDNRVIMFSGAAQLTEPCTTTRAMNAWWDEEVVQIHQTVGHGYYANFASLDGATINVSDQYFDNFAVSTNEVRRAINPSEGYGQFLLSTELSAGRMMVTLEPGPIDEDGPIGTGVDIPGILFGSDNDFFEFNIVDGHLYEITVTPTNDDDLTIFLYAGFWELSEPAIIETGAAGATERQRVLAMSTTKVQLSVERYGDAASQGLAAYTLHVTDLGLD